MVSKVAGPPANEAVTLQNPNFDDGKSLESKTNVIQHHTEEHTRKAFSLNDDFRESLVVINVKKFFLVSATPMQMLHSRESSVPPPQSSASNSALPTEVIEKWFNFCKFFCVIFLTNDIDFFFF